MNRTPIVGLKKFRFRRSGGTVHAFEDTRWYSFPFFLLNGSGMILAFGTLACSLHLKTEGL